MKQHFSQLKLSLITLTLILGSVIMNSAVNMNAPLLPDIGAFFNASDRLVQWIMIAFFLGTSVAALAYGPLADYYGRKIILFIGMSIFSIASILCIFSESIYQLIVFRFFQGFGGVASSVIWLTIIKDIYKGHESVQVLNVFNITISISLSISPMLGTYVAEFLGWRGTFSVLGFFSILQLFLIFFIIPETLHLTQRPFVSLKKAFSGFLVVFSNKNFVILAILNGIIHGVHASQTPLFSVLFQESLGISREAFALYQFIPIIFYSLSSAYVKNIVSKWGLSKTFVWGFYWLAIYCISILITLAFFPKSGLFIGGTYCIFSICCPFIATVVTTLAMESTPAMGGVSSSSMTSMRQLMASLITFSGAQLYDASFWSIGLVMLFYVIFLGVLTLWGRSIEQLKTYDEHHSKM
jgi:DHA1 family bicyclomycin/chloramphenicol resistance-like MFS transporter